jgi:hypothetical protein
LIVIKILFQIKQDRFEDKKTPGYQSKLLENIMPSNEDNENQDNIEGMY